MQLECVKCGEFKDEKSVLETHEYGRVPVFGVSDIELTLNSTMALKHCVCFDCIFEWAGHMIEQSVADIAEEERKLAKMHAKLRLLPGYEEQEYFTAERAL